MILRDADAWVPFSLHTGGCRDRPTGIFRGCQAGIRRGHPFGLPDEEGTTHG